MESLALIDSGATISLISEKLVQNKLKGLAQFAPRVTDANGNEIPILGQIPCQITTPEGKLNEFILVYKDLGKLNVSMILGMNILNNADLNFALRLAKFRVGREKSPNNSQIEVKIPDNNIIELDRPPSTRGIKIEKEVSTPKGPLNPPDQSEERPDAGESRTDNPEGEGHGDKVPSNKVPPAEDGESKVKPQVTPLCPNMEGAPEHPSTSTPELNNMVNFHALEDIVIKPNSMTIVSTKANNKIKGKTLMLNSCEFKRGVHTANICSKEKEGTIVINLLNLSDKKVKITQGTKLCTGHIIENEKIRIITDDKNSGESNGDKKPRKLTEDDILCEMEGQKESLLELLNKYRHAVWLKDEPLGTYTKDSLQIKLMENRIVNKPQYRIPHSKKEELDKCIQNMLKEGIIKRSKSPYNSPLIVIQKSNGEIRPVIDYREINKITQPLSFPLPRISDLLNSMGEAKIISSLDLASAYHQCNVYPDDREKTAFTVNNSKYEFQRVPFGLTGAPGYFSRIINDILYPILGSQVFCYLDDIIVVSKNIEDHFIQLQQVLHRLGEANIKLKLEKCKFFASEVNFLGYKISEKGLKMDPRRVEVIKQMPSPKCKKELQALLGCVNYYRLFIREFADIAEPLYELLRKNKRYEWGPRQEEAVKKLKKALGETPILKFPDFKRPFILHTDASLTGIGACLLQKHNGVLHPISFFSKCLSETQRNYSVTKREFLALVWGLEQNRHLILGYPVHIYTDHFPLTGILEKQTKDACLQRWALLVQEYAARIHYLPGKENWLADSLSRLNDRKITENSAENIPQELNDNLMERVNQISELSSFFPKKSPWTEDQLRQKQLKDPECIKIKKAMKNDINLSPKINKFKLIKGLLYVHRTISRGPLRDEFMVPYVPDELMADAFKVIHSDTTAGHKGHERTLKLFVKNFYNSRESTILKDLVNKCEQCIKAKGIPKEIPIQKYPIPTRPFHTISIDLLGPLKRSAKYNRYIFVCRDTTTRYTILRALENKETDSIIEALREIISHYGSSKVVVSDNAQEFISEKLKKFLSFYNSKKVEVSPYHPSSNGVVERINTEVAKLLRMYCNHYQWEWDDLLPTIQLTINSTYHSHIKETPFFALYAFDSSSVSLDSPKIDYRDDDLNTHLSRVKEIRKHCHSSLLKAQDYYTDYTNRNRQEKSIKVGQRVWAKIDNNKKAKLDYPIDGPFVVIGTKGKSFKIKSEFSPEVFTVHPDKLVIGRGNAIPSKDSNPPLSPAIVTKKYNLRDRVKK